MLLAQYRTGALQAGRQAADLLARLLAAAEAGDRVGSVLEVLVLQALTDQARGDRAGALAPLRRALELAAPEAYVQVFLDEGAPMAELLSAAGPGAVYARRLLERPTVAPPARPAGLVEPLSARELDVLRLLTSELTGPDIARELVLSLNTVRTHTKNIYAKLGVGTRRAAVRRAAELDLLRPR